MSDEELLQWNARGFLPGPEETEEEFVQRIEKAKQSVESAVPRAHWEWPRAQLKELFDVAPESLHAFYSNKGLSLWQGAACWIEEGVAKLQLREGFRKGKYLGLYSREEVLAHEAVHAARAMFEEPENEEFFAFAAAEKRWRRVLGPIVKRPWEVWVFLSAMAAGFVWNGATLLAALWVALGFWRLGRQHRRLKKAGKKLTERLGDAKKARALLFRLTDEEIRQVAKGEELKGDTSLRWRLLRKAYL